MCWQKFLCDFLQLHLRNTTRFILVVLLFIGTVSFAQNKSLTKALATTTNQELSFDTSKIAILAINKSDLSLFENANYMQLTNQDLKSIDQILYNCIQTHNSKQDTTNRFNEFIDLKKYKFQYVPFISSNRQRKVYINAFCNSYFDWSLNSTGWKKLLIEVDDGGSCYFHLTINLTENKYEQFYTNVYE